MGWLALLTTVGAGTLVYALDPISDTDPFSVGFLFTPVMGTAGLVFCALVARRVLATGSGLRVALDTVWLALAATAVGWPVFVDPLLDRPVDRVPALALATQAVVGALLVGFVGAVAVRVPPRALVAWLRLTAFPVALVGAAALYGIEYATGHVESGGAGDVAFSVAAACTVLGALHPSLAEQVVRRPVLRIRYDLAVTWVPIAVWAAAVALRGVTHAAELRWLGAAIAAVLVVRLSALVRDNAHLIDRLEQQATRDPLTGLPNRRALDALVADWRAPAAALVVDLDRFKAVNDALGHGAGDELLKLVARRLRTAAGSGWTVGRLGGDEFAVVSSATGSRDAAYEVARRIVERLELPFLVDRREMWIGASVGVATSEDGLDPAELVDAADLALRTAKAAGRGVVVRVDEDLRRRARDRQDLEADLRHAADRDELFCLYQPKVDLVTGALVGAEALVRWDRPGHGVVPPGEFIAVAEASGHIATIDRFVLHDAVRRLHVWNQATGGPRLAVSTNMSAWELARIDVDADVRRALAAEGGVDPGQLTIELTETLLVEDPALVARRLQKLRGAGVGVSVDDFGAGFTAIAYLRRFPISEVKIDRSLVDELTGGPADARSVVAAVIALARALDLHVVAEGVETVEQAAALRRLGCRVAQGFLFARPLTVEDFSALVGAPPPWADLVGEATGATDRAVS
ncbi:MAG: EAL domain-containing protein [Actinomyces sp.]|nr:MAG: EAL domain-containing protein [Actinomyces sp.]